MSYPRHIRALVIEDEQVPIDNYRALFEQFATKSDLAPPIFARSHEDAITHLSSNSIFHLVIVDLGLPRTAHETAQGGVDPSFDIVARCAKREEYPIPCVLVIRGRLGQASLENLRESLQRDFWHGKMVNKGIDGADAAIESALGKASEYCAIGIHIRDGGDKRYPPLSPREDDLLRRCILAEPFCVGVDLEWWGVYQSTSATIRNPSGITKVLWGCFLLSGANDPSRPWFFKFEATEDANYSHRDVALMVQKLSHIKRCTATRGFFRSLIVTQQVGDSSARPISVADLLAKPSDEAIPALPGIVSDIATQLASLGSITEDQLPISKLFWGGHDQEKIRSAYVRYGGDIDSEPVALLEKLRSASTLMWIKRRNCTHGDLNATNIALEATASGYRAFIIDGAGMRVDTAGRDLAMLEVTLLLHHDSRNNTSIVEGCAALYADTASSPQTSAESEEWPPTIRNTFALVREIRKQALQVNDLRVYALLIFDCAMLQLGGLTVQSRGNKIANSHDAVLLANLAVRWLQMVAPDLSQP